MTTETICSHDPKDDCGCWLDEEGNVRRHAFRFLVGDRVRSVQWKGMHGTVTYKWFGGGYSVKFDPITKGGEGFSKTMSNFEIEHVQ